MRLVKMPRLRSLRLRIILAYVLGVGLIITPFVLIAVVTLKSDSVARMDLTRMDVSELTKAMAGKLRFDATGAPTGFDADDKSPNWGFDFLTSEAGYRVLDETGKTALLSRAGSAFWPADRASARLARERFDFTHEGVNMYGATEPFEHAGRTWYLQVGVSVRLMALLYRVALPLVVAGVTVFSLALLLAFGLCVYITLRLTLKPLRDVSDSAAAISPRSLHARLSTESVPSEIAPLVASFNGALQRLEHGYRVQQEFLASAAHELKTPLALIRAQIELGEGATKERDALLSDVEYMTRQVQQLLHLAEASEEHNYRFGLVQVQETAEEVVAYLRRMAEAQGVHIEIVAAEPKVQWQADRGALFTLLKNLLENAIQHAPRGSSISVEIQADTLSVRDQGPGVTDAQLPLLFERFWRAPERRDQGAGLGLSICQEIALAHGWRLSAEQAAPGLRLRLSMRG
ncbi:ATP-binding protein [Niveibacterium sp. SC-1]|uniref:sensor histidine kinase n=1 Tax=Niveibacterium sp. SC-1 TaxID=3135646 RepID=UPI00311D59B3